VISQRVNTVCLYCHEVTNWKNLGIDPKSLLGKA
jgi:hypothetical protein